MIFTIKDSICFGTTVCEDNCGWDETFAFVIDGASGLLDFHVTDSETDAKWLADELAVFLQSALKDSNCALRDILFSAAMHLKVEYDRFWERRGRANPPEYPSAGVTVLRIKDGKVEYFGLGDCILVIETTAGEVEVIAEKKLVSLDQNVIDHMVELSQKTGCSVLEARKVLNYEVIANRKLRNRPEGYWIFDPTGEGVHHGRTQQWEVGKVKTALLMSDGFGQLVSPFGVAKDYRELHDLVSQKGITFLVETLLELQKIDANCTSYPRFKTSDDITAVLVDCGIT